MRKIRPDARIILSSGYNEDDVASRLRNEEVDAFLQKPYEPETLVQTFRKLLES